MALKKVVIVSPALARENNGNWQTASRWAHFLRGRYDAVIVRAWTPDLPAPDLLIALHARRAAASLAAFAEAHPERPSILVLTGTDLYRDIATDANAQASLRRAHALVVLQEAGLALLPAAVRATAHVIYQSAPALAPYRHGPTRRICPITMVGHLRAEKDPLTFIAAAALVASPKARMEHIGGVLDPALGEAAAAAQAANRRYRWLGNLAHAATRQRLKRSHAMVIASRMEGGANVIIEAVTSGVPVLASDISGNRGMLGDDYAGYFAAGDAAALARLIDRSIDDTAFYRRLCAQCAARAALFAPAAERAALLGLVDNLLDTHPPTPGQEQPMSTSSDQPIKLTSFSHGGGCGCKIAPGVLAEILKNSSGFPVPKELMVGIETADDAAVYKLNDEQALIATTDFFMPIVDDPFDFGRIAATNAISDVYAMGGTPIMALALVGMPINKLPLETIGQIIRGGESICAEAGIPIAGGHTIDSVEPIYGLVVLGLVHPSKVKRNADSRDGDILILSKPLGVGVLSAALKKDALGADGYAAMIENTTKLNKPGIELAKLDGVHALTDITGFGLLGHLLELARGAKLTAQLDMAAIPLLPGVEQLAHDGFFTGASGRNWDAYGKDVDLGAGVTPAQQALLTDPQTSGGLLVACDPASVDEVLALFAKGGFGHAAVIGKMQSGAARVTVS